jgi:N-carbamoyl-L-amino-acid hydrolase
MLARLHELGEIGADARGGRTRLALTSEDKQGRDLIVAWLREAGAEVHVDQIGNIYGVVQGEAAGPPVMVGSHIDTVTRAGAYDGCYGVVAGIEILLALATCGMRFHRSFAVAVFTNEEGARFGPDLLGSRVLARAISLQDALSARARDGAQVSDELERIGYAGLASPWNFVPHAFLELHIEQGPILERQGGNVGVVEAVQGHAWWRVAIEGTANHAGTTPMDMRSDAGFAAMTLATRLVRHSATERVPAVATVGTFDLEPGAVNVVPGRAVFTLDLRDQRDHVLHAAEELLFESLRALESDGFRVSSECFSRHASVSFDPHLCRLLETEADALDLRVLRMSSGASHDAQMMASLCPTAMVFVPSHRGISHNPAEHTEPEALASGAALLFRAVQRLANSTGGVDGFSGV